MELINFSDFSKIQMAVGTIMHAEPFLKAKKPAYILTIDFGKFGIKKSSAQITKLYSCDVLVGKQIVAVINFPKKQIANVMSECLVLGVADDIGNVVLLTPDFKTENGLSIS
ncbi:MAG: tRNA-binding protein [Flavobacterium sp.]